MAHDMGLIPNETQSPCQTLGACVIGPHTYGNAARYVVGDLNAEGRGQPKP